jgi:hypothetical protein
MITLGDEDDLLKDIEEGVEIAIHRLGYDADAVDPIKFNKLGYLAIHEFDLPITYGWYKFGPAPVNTATQSVNIRPAPPNGIVAADEPRLTDINLDNRSPEEYSYHFTDDLQEFDRILETPTKDYLVRFYFEHAPDRFRDLYVASVELQQVLDDIESDPSWHEEGTEYLDLLRTRFPRVISEVRATPVLEESVSAIEAYGTLLTDIVETAVERPALTEAQQRFLGRVVRFFYGGAWKYVALLVSRETVDLSPGTNQDRLRNNIDEDIRQLRTEYDQELNRLAERAERFELLSESPDFDERREWATGGLDADETFDTEETASLSDIRGRLE